MVQSDQYNEKEEVAYIADFPGADPDNELIVVSVDDIPEPLKTTIHEALSSQGDDSLLVDSNNELASDIQTWSAGVLEITDNGSFTLNEYTGGTLPTEQQSPVGVEDSSGGQIDPATDSTLSSELSREIATWSAGVLDITDNGSFNVNNYTGDTVPTELQSAADITDDQTREIGKARMMDSGGILVDPVDAEDLQPVTNVTSSTGQSNAAVVDLGAHRKDVDIFYDVTGAATVTIEVSKDAATWREMHVESIDAAETDILQLETSYQHIRAYADANLNTIEISSKGD